MWRMRCGCVVDLRGKQRGLLLHVNSACALHNAPLSECLCWRQCWLVWLACLAALGWIVVAAELVIIQSTLGAP